MEKNTDEQNNTMENQLTENIKLNEHDSPAEEFRNESEKRNNKKLLALLVFAVEIVACVFIIRISNKLDLDYRVPRQIENTLTGQNHFSTGVYTGETDFGYFTGDAVFEYKTGSVYTGEWENNNMNGTGTLKVPKEGTYKGEFALSQKNGKGTYTWVDGTIYSGNWKDDQMEGEGTYISADDLKYTGVFEDNLFKSGNCVFKNKIGKHTIHYSDFKMDNMKVAYSDGTTYNGDADGEGISGIGIMKFSSGDVYEGGFNSGKRSGQGEYSWKNGDKYSGDWADDTMNGSGIYTYKNGNSAEGDFKRNKFMSGSYTQINDRGKYIFSINNNKIFYVRIMLNDGTVYSGDIENGKLNGNAEITYSNGDHYNGNVKNGCKNGRGVYKWAKGGSYDGEWSNDKMNGSGVYFYPPSKKSYKLEGQFVNGKPNGKCRYFEHNYRSYKTEWRSGRCVKIYE